MTESSNRLRSKLVIALTAAGLLVAGGGIGAAAIYAVSATPVMAPVRPVPIASLATSSQPLFGENIVSIRGKVVEIYGRLFILADTSGRALVESGRPHSSQSPVALNDNVTVQGRFEDGVFKASFLVGADGKVTAFNVHPRHHDRPGLRGPRGDHGRHGGDEAAQTPPPAPVDPEL